VLEEERVDTSSHLRTLPSCLRVQILIDELLGVPKLFKLDAHLFSLSGKLVALHDYFALSVDVLTNVLTLHDVAPAVPEVAQAVRAGVHEHAA